jgi:hypothetical protein
MLAMTSFRYNGGYVFFFFLCFVGESVEILFYFPPFYVFMVRVCYFQLLGLQANLVTKQPKNNFVL